MKRREFLLHVAKKMGLAHLVASGVVTSLSQLKAYASEVDHQHNLLVLTTQGGSYGPISLDPIRREHLSARGVKFGKEFHNCYRDEEITTLNINGEEIMYGYSASPLVKHAEDLAIVRGVTLNTKESGHPYNINYISSGSRRSSAAEFPVQICQAMGGSPLGVGYLRHNNAFRVGSYMDVNTFTLGSTPQSELKPSFNENSFTAKQYRMLKRFQQRGDQLTNVEQNMIELVESRAQMFNNIISFEELQSIYSEVVYEAQVAAFLMLSQQCRFAFIDLANYLGSEKDKNIDSHTSHRPRQRTATLHAYDQFSKILDMFKELGLFENTTIIGLNEFGRYPFKEGLDGSDHNPRVNELIACGKNIKGGQAIGASHFWKASEIVNSGTSMLQAAPFDFQRQRYLSPQEELQLYDSTQLPLTDLELDGDVAYLKPEDFLRTVCEAMGLQAPTPEVQKGRVIKALIE